jgi:hypothetical protein
MMTGTIQPEILTWVNNIAREINPHILVVLLSCSVNYARQYFVQQIPALSGFVC